MSHPPQGQLGEVDQPIGAPNVDERTEIAQRSHRPPDDLGPALELTEVAVVASVGVDGPEVVGVREPEADAHPVSVVQRRELVEEIGDARIDRRRKLPVTILLRALGMQRRQLLRMLLREAVLLASAGTACGIALGLLAASGMVRSLEGFLGLAVPGLRLTEERREQFDPKNLGETDKPVNIFEAIGNGAMTGMQVAFAVGAMLISFVGLIYLVNGLLGVFGGLLGFEDLTVQWLLGKVFAPIAFLLGVPWGEAAQAGSLIGQKLVINEFYAYASFVGIKETLSPYTQLVVTFALCGFSNLASIAILLGGLGAVVPSRRHDIARFGLRAVIAGTLVNLLNASLAGFFFTLQ